jgi:hypothetical protein
MVIGHRLVAKQRGKYRQRAFGIGGVEHLEPIATHDLLAAPSVRRNSESLQKVTLPPQSSITAMRAMFSSIST